MRNSRMSNQTNRFWHVGIFIDAAFADYYTIKEILTI